MIRTTFSDQLHAEKYRGERESFKEAMSRISGALTETKEEFHAFRDPLLGVRFMPGGRIQASMGATKRVTPYNCFVSGKIEDSFVDGDGSIMARAIMAAATMRMGGGIGYDFSSLRPSGDLIRKLGSRSSGPVSFMEIYDAVCRCIASAGHRRGAQMGVLRVDHPDIEKFIHAKQPGKVADPIFEMMDKCTPGSPEWNQWNDVLQEILGLTGFNLSIGITNKFMECLATGKPFKLRWGGRVYREIDAQALWEMIMRATWDWAEPGVIFIDTINQMNNLWYCEQILATNPCGEQPLPPFGACLLGSFNLPKYLVPSLTGGVTFDWEQFIADIPPVVRAMDNVVDTAIYPLYEQEQEAKNKRRMGLGITGLANALEVLGMPYGSPRFLDMEAEILDVLNREAYRASALLAKEKGAFPLYDEEKYLQGKFIQTLDLKTQGMIKKYGIRNSHLTSIAPTGTISLCADNVSSAIEPVFAYEYDRTIQTPTGAKIVPVQDYALMEHGVRGKQCKDVTVDEHVDVLLTAAKRVDSAVSKTCNVPADTDWDDFKSIYVRAWEGGAKGCTTYQVGGKRFGILNTNEDGAASCRIDPTTGRKECD